MSRSQWLFIISINFLFYSPLPNFCLFLSFFNQGPQQPWRAALAVTVARGRKRRKEVQVVRQWEASSVLSLRGELALSIPARWELKWRQFLILFSHLIYSYFLHPSAYCLDSRREGSAERYLCGHQGPQAIPSEGVNSSSLSPAALIIADRCISWLNRNCLGRWLIIQTPVPHSWRFWFCRPGMLSKTFFLKSPKCSWWAVQLAHSLPLWLAEVWFMDHLHCHHLEAY